MILPIVKKGTDLTAPELRQMHTMMGFDPAEPVDYIQQLHTTRMDTMVYLYKKNKTLLAFQMVSWHYRVTPFSKRPLPVLYINLSFKKSDTEQAVKDFSRRTSYRALQDTLGRFWWTKRFVVTFTTFNPKASKRIQRAFSASYPTDSKGSPVAIQAFAQDFVRQCLQRPVPVSPDLILPLQGRDDAPIDVTDDWPILYASDNNQWNDFFFQHELFEKRDNRIYYTSKWLLFFLGYYHPTSFLWKTLQRWIKKRTHSQR